MTQEIIYRVVGAAASVSGIATGTDMAADQQIIFLCVVIGAVLLAMLGVQVLGLFMVMSALRRLGK